MKLRWFTILFIHLPFILFVLLFTYLTINYLPTLPNSPNPDSIGANHPNVFLEYYNAHLSFLIYPASLFVFFFILYIFNGSKLAAKHTYLTTKTIAKQTLRYAFGLVIIAAVAFPISFAAVYIYAFFQINYHILAYNSGSTEKQFSTSPQAIADAIAQTDELSVVPLSQDTYKKELLLLSIKKKSGFYEERILPGFPGALYKRSYLPQTAMVFVNNHLAVNTITPSQLAIISPALGKFLIEYSTQRSLIKPLPAIEILEKPDYIAVRKNHMQNRKDQLDGVISTIDDKVASISGYMTSNEESIAKNRELVVKAEEQKKTAKCKTQERCTSIKAKWDKVISQANSNIAKAETALAQNQAVLGTSVQNKEKVQNVKTEITVAEVFTEYELGLFSPPNKITMTIEDPNDPQAFDAYLQTLIHEYFHYISYANDDVKLNNFFEEALTEYFARMAFENYTGQKIDIGYQVGVRIIEAMTKRVPERELLGIYYSKDQKALEQLLNKTYGQNFYQENSAAFTMLNHLPLDKSVIVANLIMEQIDGNELTIKDPQTSEAFSIPSPDSSTIPLTEVQSTLELP